MTDGLLIGFAIGGIAIAIIEAIRWATRPRMRPVNHAEFWALRAHDYYLERGDVGIAQCLQSVRSERQLRSCLPS